jgi:hypothetical protein
VRAHRATDEARMLLPSQSGLIRSSSSISRSHLLLSSFSLLSCCLCASALLLDLPASISLPSSLIPSVDALVRAFHNSYCCSGEPRPSVSLRLCLSPALSSAFLPFFLGYTLPLPSFREQLLRLGCYNASSTSPRDGFLQFKCQACASRRLPEALAGHLVQAHP